MLLNTRLVSIATDDPDAEAIAEAARILHEGRLVAFPTETVYGLGADATNPAAVARIFEAKGRPPTNPLIVHVDTVAMALHCSSDWPDAARLLVDAFWPGPLTVVVPRSPLIPDIVTAGRETVGIRMPAGTIAQRLITELARPIAAPSANRSTGISPTLASHVMADLKGKIEMIIDGGPTRVGLESTVVDLTTREPRILRPGPIAAGMIRHVLGGTHVREEHRHVDLASETAAAPGQSSLHYAPHTPVVLLSDTTVVPTSGKFALLVLCRDAPPQNENVEAIALFRDAADAAHSLYATLQAWDRRGFDAIHVIMPPDTEAWRGVRDRLIRAAGLIDNSVDAAR